MSEIRGLDDAEISGMLWSEFCAGDEVHVCWIECEIDEI